MTVRPGHRLLELGRERQQDRLARRHELHARGHPAGLADRLIEPFVAEAKAALAEGIVDDADLVDAGAIFGAGFAPFRGGPLQYARTAADGS